MANSNPSKKTRFTSSRQPSPERKVAGRKKKGAMLFLEKVKYEMPDIVIEKGDYYQILKVILSSNKEYISELSKDENIPVSLLCIIKAIKTDIDEGSTRTIDSLLDRLFGKSEQPVVGAAGRPLIPQSIDVTQLTDEQLAAIASIHTSKETEE